MGAGTLSLKTILLSIACALLTPASAFTQPAFSLSQTTVNLLGLNPVAVMVSSTSSQIGFSATITASTDSWLCVDGSQNPVSGLTTPANLTFNVCGQPNIFITNHTATVTLSETDGAGAATAAIQLSYITSGGAAAVTASPSSITATTASGGLAVSTPVTLSTSSVTPIAFTLVPPQVPWVTWFQSNGLTGFVSATQPATLSVTLNGAGQPSGVFSTALTVNTNSQTLAIPATLVIGAAGAASLSASPSVLTWFYSTARPGIFPSATTLTMSSTNGAIQYNATAASSNGWLLINNAFAASGTVGVTPVTISPSTNLAALTPGTYIGTVSISGSDGSTAAVAVTATVTTATSVPTLSGWAMILLAGLLLTKAAIELRRMNRPSA